MPGKKYSRKHQPAVGDRVHRYFHGDLEEAWIVRAELFGSSVLRVEGITFSDGGDFANGHDGFISPHEDGIRLMSRAPENGRSPEDVEATRRILLDLALDETAALEEVAAKEARKFADSDRRKEK